MASLEDKPRPSNTGFKVFSLLVFLAALFGVMDMDVLGICLGSSQVNRPLFDLNLLAVGGILCCKLYLEAFRVGVKGEAVAYEDAQTTTHIMLLLILASFLLFSTALWPVYGFFSVVVSAMIGYGVIFNFLLLLPIGLMAQNAVLTLAYTTFLYHYVGM